VSGEVRVSVVVPTYKRGRELQRTLGQIHAIMSAADEVIVVDQTPTHPPDVRQFLLTCAAHPQTRVLHVNRPSVTLARNIGLLYARAPVVLFLDDDVDVERGLIEEHLAYYVEPDVIGVAGGYFMGTRAVAWKPSGTARSARALAGVNMSFRRDAMIQAGGEDTNFGGGGAGEDWEFGERMRRLGRLANGGDCMVLHRAPVEGGAGNQRRRGPEWYLEAYHNHIYWMLKRPFPQIITRMPRHLYWIAKYNIPQRDVLMEPAFWLRTLPLAVLRALRTRLRGRRPPFWPDSTVTIVDLSSGSTSHGWESSLPTTSAGTVNQE